VDRTVTDVCNAFVSPDTPGTVTLIANLPQFFFFFFSPPLKAPAGGPNFYEFGDDVIYEIPRRQQRGRRADPSRSSSWFRTTSATAQTSCTIPARSALDSRTGHRRQSYDHVRLVSAFSGPGPRHRAGLPACNIGPCPHAELRRAGRPGDTPLAAGIRCSPGRGQTKPSTSTWARS